MVYPLPLTPTASPRKPLAHPSRTPRAKGFRKLLSLKELVGETNLVFREDAVRLGLFIGGFTAFHEFLRGVVAHVWQGKQDTVSRYGEIRNDREMCTERYREKRERERERDVRRVYNNVHALRSTALPR